MKSIYKKLGDYIEPCNEKNEGNLIKKLQGISNRKYFQKAKTNTIGIDLSKYRVVRRGQFAFNRATTRNSDRISIALRFDEDCIVSPSYRIFKSKDENVLNSEYLMMWFKRPKFDRYARFKSHGSAHEFFDLGEMYDVQLPIPSIEKQQEVVNEYNTITNRILLNKQLNQKLEETAQALYKYWFVDFEFPNKEGKPYKSSGGKMMYNEELDKEIPLGWEVDELINKSSLLKRGISPKYAINDGITVINQRCIRDNTVDLAFSRLHDTNQKIVPTEKILKTMDVLVNSTGTGTLGRVGVIKKMESEMTVDSHVTIVRANNNLSKFYLASFLSNNEATIVELGEGSTGQTELSRTNLGEMLLIVPTLNIQELFEEKAKMILEHIQSIESYKPHLLELKNLVLSKMTKVEVGEALV